jgi:transketolase
MIDAFIEAADEGIELLVAVSDSTSTSKIQPFADKFPERVVNVGIAEQNLIGMSAGLALGGYVVATANAAPFLVNRSAEQVRNDIAYTDTNVKMMGLNPGFAYGALGPTHHSLEDLSMMRGLGGVRIYTPIDPRGTRDAVLHALRSGGPAYVRVDSGSYADIPRPAAEHPVDEPLRLSSGSDLTLIGLGTASHAVLGAVEILNRRGAAVDAWAVPSLRPLNVDALVDSLTRTGKAITVEEHSVHGGLGSFVSEQITDRGLAARLIRLGVPEGEFAPASPRPAIRKRYSLDSEGIATVAKGVLES